MAKTNIRVGDVVEYVNKDEYTDNLGVMTTGMMGTVVCIDKDASWPVEVDFHAEDGINYPMSTSEILQVIVTEDH